MRDLKFPRRKLAIEKFTQEPTTIGFQTMVSPGKRSFVPANCDFSKSSDFENIEKWENEMWTLMVGWAKEHLACSKTDEMLAQRLTRVSMAYAKGVRQMSGGHHASPQGGLDGLVRKYLPEDHHVVLGILGLYTSLYFLSKIGSGKKQPSAVTDVAVSSTTEGIPSIESPDFDSWISAPGNVEKLFA